jgi:hypothetical protein
MRRTRSERDECERLYKETSDVIRKGIFNPPLRHRITRACIIAHGTGRHCMEHKRGDLQPEIRGALAEDARRRVK